jgi:hypothetical protein
MLAIIIIILGRFCPLCLPSPKNVSQFNCYGTTRRSRALSATPDLAVF